MAKASLQKRISRYALKTSWQDNFTGIILTAVVLVVIGLLLYNYFGRQSGSENQAAKEEVKIENSDQSGFGEIVLPATYKVSTGDSLVQIAEKYYKNSDYWPGLVKANKLENSGTLEAGQEINVPKTQEVESVTVSDIAPKDQGTISGTTYTVQYGDTLSSIAQRAYGDWSKWQVIDQANQVGRLPNGSPLIHSGNVLVIPR